MKLKKVLSMLLILTVFLSLCACGKKEKSYDPWPSSGLASLLPTPQTEKTKISNYSSFISITIDEADEEFYTAYIAQCEAAGFTVETEKSANSFRAFHWKGNELKIDFYRSLRSISIHIYEAKELGTLRWPYIGLAELIPAPDSTLGNITKDASNEFSAEIGNMSKEDFADYVEWCKVIYDFTVDYSGTDTSYTAKNPDGVSIKVTYEGFSIMTVTVTAPTQNDTPAPTDAPQPTDTSAPESSAPPATEPSKGMRSEFKAAMDAYEQFYAEYCQFLKDFSKNPADLTLIGKYSEMMSKLTEMDAAFEKWGEDDLSAEEIEYYLEVSARVVKMLSDTYKEIG